MESEEPGHEEYRYNIGPIEHDPFIPDQLSVCKV